LRRRPGGREKLTTSRALLVTICFLAEKLLIAKSASKSFPLRKYWKITIAVFV
jgi:hypothetical protein